MQNRDDRDLMLELGLHAARSRRPRRRIVPLAAGALVLASLGWALPEASRSSTQGTALEEVLASGRRSQDIRTIVEHTQARLLFSKNVSGKLAIGNEEILHHEVLNNRELLLLGRSVGTTTVTVWFEDGTLEQFLFTVRRDTSILDAALRQVDPGITAMLAPERDALVLSGTVSDRRAAVEAQKVAANYMGSGSSDANNIINLIRVDGEIMDIGDVIQQAIREQLGCTAVTVKQVVQSRGSDDASILVLGGKVPRQTDLIRALTLASRLFLQQDLIDRRARGEYEETTQVLPSGESRTTRRPLRLEEAFQDIRVAADESGALFEDDNGGGMQNRRGLSQAARMLRNRIENNVGRSKAIELAEGRILSFIEVEDHVQVRVDVRFVEVNRNELLDWDSSFSAEYRDFNGPSRYRPETYTINDQGQIVPGVGGRTGNPDYRDILSFLGGRLTNQFGISGDHWDVESILSVLETENIVRTLSSPSLTVLSGEIAEFRTGGQIPIEQTVFSGTGVAESNVVFVDFGVELAVRPLVDEQDYIVLDLIPNLTDPDPNLTEQILLTSGTNPPTTAFSQRGLRTTTRLRDGQSLLIGGLTEHSRRDESGQTPWLNEIPVIGWLFKDFSYRDADRDLVILVNPTIVRAQPELASLWIYPSDGEPPAPAAPAETGDEDAGGSR